MVQSGMGGTYSVRCLATWQLWIPGKHGFGRSGLAGLICLPREHGYTYQTSVTGGTTHLPQTVKGKGSGFCLDYFQSYLRHTNEDIQSSESGCHFGHYKAASYDRYLLAMHAAKLTTLATSTGIPLPAGEMDSWFFLRRCSGLFT